MFSIHQEIKMAIDPYSLEYQNSLIKSIAQESSEMMGDALEVAIDANLADGIIKEIPVVKTIYSLCKVGLGIREHFFIKKISLFIQHINESQLDTELIKEFKINLSNNPNLASKITENITILIDKFTSLEKSKILGNLFASYVKKDLTWDEYVSLSFCLEIIHPDGFKALNTLANEQPTPFSTHKSFFVGEAFLIDGGIAERNGSHLRVNDFGQKLYNYGKISYQLSKDPVAT
jgi:hypothetical protein